MISGSRVVIEKDIRSTSLKSIFKKRNKAKDLFIFADDIIFLDKISPGLFQNNDFGILGMQMVKPNTMKIHNTGFKLIELDGLLTYVPLKDESDEIIM